MSSRLDETVQAAALGLMHGAAELVPVSSSAHVAAVPWLLGWEIAAWPGARMKALEVALHAGTALALAPQLLPRRRELPLAALAFVAPAAVGLAFEDVVERRLRGPVWLAAGLLAGSAALVAADRCAVHRTRADAGVGDALWLGCAQAAALVPGVSRTGATIAVARARGFSRPDASGLSFAVAGPVLAGATLLKGVRLSRSGVARAEGRALVAGAAAAFVSAMAAKGAIGAQRERPLWPWAAERTLLAGALIARRRLPNRRAS